MLKVGYSRKNITPAEPTPLAGYGNTSARMSQGWYSQIYATCIAFTDDQDQTMLLYTTDMIRAQSFLMEDTAKAISEATGVPETNIQIAATHTHSAPDPSNRAEPSILRFNAMFTEKMVEAAQEALADRKEATFQASKINVPGMCFVRSYITDTGEVIGVNFGDPKGKKLVAHTMPADEQMLVVRVCREGGKDILMVNWQGHPQVASTRQVESGLLLRPFLGADYIGSMRDHVEKETELLFAFFLGASGNLNTRSDIPEEMPTTDYRLFGQQLGDYAVKAMETMEPLASGAVKVQRRTYTGELDHSEDCMIDDARYVADVWKKTNDKPLCDQLSRERNMHSPYHALAIITRYNAGAEQSMDLNAAVVGDLGFACAPYEMFCDNGQQIKEGSPCPMTFVVTCCNASVSYVASAAAYEHGSYEVDNRKFSKGIGETLVGHFTDMLTQLKK